MQATTLSFSNLHAHGMLFSNLLRARHRTFIEQAQWDLPQADGMEFDQYDTPASRWLVVHDEARVLAGARLTPTKHRCGIYSYMIRDAQRGLLETIPSNLLFDPAPVSDRVWELSRGFVCDDVPAPHRRRVHARLVGELVRASREVGATQVLGLVSPALARLGVGIGLDCEAAGPMLSIENVANLCVRVRLSDKLH